MTETTSQKHKNPTHKKREGGRKMKRLVIAVVTAVILLSAGAVMAATATDTLTVQATCIDVCMISSTTDVDFGAYDPTDPLPNTDGQGSITFRCTKGSTYEVYIVRNNVMNGPDTLNYELYTDLARTAVFPSGLTGSPDTSACIASMTRQIYGKIPALQDAAAGAYSESVTATVEY